MRSEHRLPFGSLAIALAALMLVLSLILPDGFGRTAVREHITSDPWAGWPTRPRSLPRPLTCHRWWPELRPRPGRAATGVIRVLGRSKPTGRSDTRDGRHRPVVLPGSLGQPVLPRSRLPTAPPGLGRSRRQGSGKVAIRPYLFNHQVVARRHTPVLVQARSRIPRAGSSGIGAGQRCRGLSGDPCR
jgi:hypothetical protein